MPTYPTTDSTGARIPNPSRPLTEGVQPNTLVQTFDSGHEQRRKKGDPRMTWEFTYLVLTDAAYRTLQNFYIARGGIAESFAWTHPLTKQQYPSVRFNMDTFSGEYFEHPSKGALWKLAVKLIQVF